MQTKYCSHQFPLCVHHSPSTRMCTCASFCLFFFFTMSSICGTLYISAHSHAPYSTHMCPAHQWPPEGTNICVLLGREGHSPIPASTQMQHIGSNHPSPALHQLWDHSRAVPYRGCPLPFPPALLPCHSPAHVPPPKAHFIPQLHEGLLQKRVKKRARAREKKKGTKAI